MLLSELPPAERVRRLQNEGLALRTGPFVFRIQSPIPLVHQGLDLLYAANPLAGDAEFVDFDLRLDWANGLRRWVRPQVRFLFDGTSPFEPLHVDHAYPLLEWSMNWCISTHAHQYLLLHAAVVERGGCAAILAAPPGSGKSTLCAGLIHRGWRLLSDELGMVDLVTGLLWPLARPVSLKNESIGIIRAFQPGSVFSEETLDTTKGTVALLKADPAHVARMDEPARPRWVVFPRYVRDAPATLAPRPKADSMMELGTNAFNYALLGQSGFEALSDLISASDCYDFSYGRLDDAVAVFDTLARQPS